MLACFGQAQPFEAVREKEKPLGVPKALLPQSFSTSSGEGSSVKNILEQLPHPLAFLVVGGLLCVLEGHFHDGPE